MNDVIELMRSHRSIRKFTDEPVGDETIAEIMQAGFAAATSSNMQATTVIRVRSSETRAEIAALAGGQPWVEQAGAFFIWCADVARGAAVAADEVEPVTDMVEHFIRATVDVALAAQNAAVAAESLGLGICYIGGIRNDPQRVCELLELPDLVYPVFGFCVGHPLKEERYTIDNDPADVAAYDEHMREYYRSRTGGKKDTSWTQDMGALYGAEARPHLREFLAGRGFNLR